MIEKIRRNEEEWKKILGPDRYLVMREHGTEAPHSCMFESLGEGEYLCAACDFPLFRSGTKFRSGTGWPSFFDPIKDDHLEYLDDNSHGMHRIEVRCARCDSHLGHVFDDGPPPSGKRYCINGVSLNFIPKK
jgi:peptide-methionine (R)-S-oxide reductase